MVLSFALIHILSLLSGNSVHHKTDLNSECDTTYISGSNINVTAALEFLDHQNRVSTDVFYKTVIASWNYQNNLTEHNKNVMLKVSQETAEFTKETWKNATSFSWKGFKSRNRTAYRMFKSLSILGEAALSPEEYNELGVLVSDMVDIYSTAKICPYEASTDSPCDIELEPGLTEILISSRNYEQLKYYWKEWRDETGKKMKEKFLRMVELLNKAAVLNGFSNAGKLRLEPYESDTFEEDIEGLWQTLKPFYNQLHAYVRKNLRKEYKGRIKPDGPIPANLLGNMWAQTWNNIFDLVNPYPAKSLFDVTQTMLKQEITPLKMFKLADEFFGSLGLKRMPEPFWNNTVMVKPTNREIVCHASAWDMYKKDDVRIKMCTRVNMQDLITVHHEMGHVEYYLQYANQPNVFRNGANPGFHEAVGDTLALSVATPSHLHKIKLIEKVVKDEEADINFLLLMALEKVAFLPFGYLMDLYRWNIFNGRISEEELNTKWWELRLKYQGVCPPVRRNESDFDAGAKYHIAADVPYIRYFVSFVIQFQFHKALCDESGHKGPLYTCDIYRSKEAGSLLSKMLELGSSVSWQDAMKVITQGETSKMDAGPMLEYFEPLVKWLEKQNEGEVIGWNSDDPMICP